MNGSSDLQQGLNRSSHIVYSNSPPPLAPFGWPGCSYPVPLPSPGTFGQAALWIWKIVPILMVLLGTVGNILTALVIFRNFRQLSSIAVYLLSLAFTDTLFLYSTSLRRFLFHGFGVDFRGISNLGCKISTFLTYTTFHISAWILVAVTVERVISVTWPYKVKRRCTKRNAVVVNMIIILMSSALDSHVLYGFELSSSDARSESDTCIPISAEYSKFFYYQWFWLHFIVGFATPFVFIAVGNTLVINALRKMRMRQRSMNEVVGDGQKPNGRPRTRHTRTLMVFLVLLNTIFFISQTPLAIYLVYYPHFVEDINKLACSDFKSYVDGVEKLAFWEALTNTFGYINASVNFVLYVVSGSRFREEVVALLTCKHESSVVSMSSFSDDNSRRHQHSRTIYHVN